MMIQGSLGGMRSFCWASLLLFMPVFFMAFVFRQSVGGEYEEGRNTDTTEPFSTLAMSIFTCFRCLVLGDCSQSEGRPVFLLLTQDYGVLYGLIYSFVAIFMTFALFNVSARHIPLHFSFLKIDHRFDGSGPPSIGLFRLFRGQI